MEKRWQGFKISVMVRIALVFKNRIQIEFLFPNTSGAHT